MVLLLLQELLLVLLLLAVRAVVVPVGAAAGDIFVRLPPKAAEATTDRDILPHSQNQQPRPWCDGSIRHWK